MRLLLILLALGCVAATPGEAPQIAVEKYTLDNGLTVLLSRDTRLPVVAVEVRYLVGSAHEPKGRSGFAHLFEHLMFQGSKSYDEEYFTPYEPIGAAVNGTTNTDRTNYYERVPSNYLELALWMESDRMSGLLEVLTQKKLDNQRDVVKNERRQRYENTPYGMVWKHFANKLYPVGHPYQHTTIGSHADLTAATLDDVKGFFKQYYVPSNAVLTIVGDFEPEATKAMIERYFGSLPAGQRAPTPTAEMPVIEKAIQMVQTDDVKLPRVYMAWHSPALYAKGDAALDVLASVLSDGKTSRLYKPLVYEQKVAKDVSAFQVSRHLGGFFVVVATAAPGVDTSALSKAMRTALSDALATPPTAQELSDTINAWKKSFFGRVESVLSRAQLLSNYEHFTGSPDYIQQDLARYTRLTAADVHAAATQWIATKKAVRIDIVPGAQPKEGSK